MNVEAELAGFLPLWKWGLLRPERPSFIPKTALTGGLAAMLLMLAFDLPGGLEAPVQCFTQWIFIRIFGLGALFALGFAAWAKVLRIDRCITVHNPTQ